MMNTNKHVGDLPTIPAADVPLLPLQILQSYLLTNAKMGGSKAQYFTPEMLELFAGNPPLELGQKIIPNIVVKKNNGTAFMIHNIHPNAPVLHLHKLIEQETGIPVHRQWLRNISGDTLYYFSTVAECKLEDFSNICLWGRLLSGPDPSSLRSSALPTHVLNDTYHSDLTNVIDDGRIFRRGGAIYNRPYGWMRFALKIDGENIWLNGTSPRPEETSSADGEWSVSYHGTGHHNGLSIASEGYKLLQNKGVRLPLGHGTFTTPNINLAQLFSQKFSLDGVQYEAIVQNRTNPSTVMKILGENGIGEYWYSPSNKYFLQSPSEQDVIPYGFCVRQV